MESIFSTTLVVIILLSVCLTGVVLLFAVGLIDYIQVNGVSIRQRIREAQQRRKMLLRMRKRGKIGNSRGTP